MSLIAIINRAITSELGSGPVADALTAIARAIGGASAPAAQARTYTITADQINAAGLPSTFHLGVLDRDYLLVGAAIYSQGFTWAVPAGQVLTLLRIRPIIGFPGLPLDFLNGQGKANNQPYGPVILPAGTSVEADMDGSLAPPAIPIATGSLLITLFVVPVATMPG